MFSFILALAAGYLAPQAEGPLARPVMAALKGWIRIKEEEVGLLSFILVMLLAGIGAELLDSGSTFWVILGGALGYFGPRLIEAGRKASGR